MAKLGVALAHAFARLAVIESTLALERGFNERASAWAIIAALSFALVRIVGTSSRARREIELSQELIQRVLRSDVFSQPLRGKQDIVIAGLHDAARVDAQILPTTFADVAMVLFVSVLAISRGDAVRLVAFLIGLVLGGLVILALRRFAWRASVRAWQARQTHVRSVLDGLEGAVEIVSTSSVDRFRARVAESMRAARDTSWVVGVEAMIVGRMPIVAGIGLTLFGVYALTGTAAPAHAVQWAVLAAMLAPFAGLTASLAILVETRGAISAVRPFLNLATRGEGSDVPTRIDDIVLNDVSAKYGAVVALANVSSRITKGVAILVGRNGSGKSSLLRVLSGLVPTTGGDVVIGGVSGARIRWSAVRRATAFLPQRPYFPVDATVRAAFTFLFDCSDEQCRAALVRTEAWAILEDKSASDPLSVRVDDLSAGERQRVALARAIARDAELFLFDEPDANLDRAGVKMLNALLDELSARAIVVVAAHATDIVRIADHVIELEDGRLVRDDAQKRAS